jgi:hypothetical protein
MASLQHLISSSQKRVPVDLPLALNWLSMPPKTNRAASSSLSAYCLKSGSLASVPGMIRSSPVRMLPVHSTNAANTRKSHFHDLPGSVVVLQALHRPAKRDRKHQDHLFGIVVSWSKNLSILMGDGSDLLQINAISSGRTFKISELGELKPLTVLLTKQ